MNVRGVNVHGTDVHESPPADAALPPAPRGRRRLLAVILASFFAVALIGGALVVRTADSPAQPNSFQLAAPADRLGWAPPVLIDPLTVTVNVDNNDLRLRPDRDYRIVLPSTPLLLTGGLLITGGRNVVLIGGEIVVPSSSVAPNPKLRRGLLLKGQFGTVHVEGLRISGDDLSEGIDIDQREGGIVQLENISVGTVHGTRDTNHADVVQVWAGPAQLRIDGLTGSTQYQGLFLLPDQFLDTPPNSYDLRRIVITGDQGGPEGKAGYLLWTTDQSPWLSVADIVLVDPRDDLRGMVHPFSAWDTGVRLQSDAAGARLPKGNPGVQYSSPGYQGHASSESATP